jgi:purine nucleosidase
MTIPVYLDCDTGIDDALALALLLASPEIDLVGVGTVSGNIDAATAARNTIDLLALAGRQDVPVAVGEHDFLTAPFVAGPALIHGGNGIGDVVLPRAAVEPVDGDAAELLVRLAHRYPGELRIIAIAPLTNLARALERDPGVAAHVRDVVVMGGSARAPGNITAVAEANIGHDPEAAQAVLDAAWPVTLVPLDVTGDEVLEDADRRRLVTEGSPVVRSVGEILDLYTRFYTGHYGRAACALHDPLAAAIVVGLVRATSAPAVPVVVDTGSGPGRGQTIVDLRGQRRGPADIPGARTRVVLGTDAPLAPWLMERLLGR